MGIGFVLLLIGMSFLMSWLYCLFLAKVVRKHERAGRWLWLASVSVLGLFIIEMAFIAVLGLESTQVLLGSAFDIVHTALLFFSPPAFANVWLLRRPPSFWSRSCSKLVLSTALACTAFSLGFQYIHSNLSIVDDETAPESIRGRSAR